MTVVLGDQRLPERFWSRVVVDTRTDCWLWTGHRSRKGYGKITDGGTSVEVHRYLYRRLVSDEIDGLDIDHLCRVRHCVNPVHLEAVTHAENIRRGRSGAPQRERTHCPRGHAYQGSNLYIARKADGSTNRQCRACKSLWAQERRESLRASA